MKWFKHYSNADSSEKLNALMDKMGIEGYGFYWLFLELISSKFDGSLDQTRVHFDEVLGKFRLNNKRKLVSFLNVLNELRLIPNKTSGKFIQIDNSILARLKQKDFKIERLKSGERAKKTPLELEENKNKEIEESKEKKSAQEAPKFFSDPVKLVSIFNEILPEKRHSHYTLGDTSLKHFLKSAKEKMKTEEDWRGLFHMVRKSAHLSSESWCSLVWLVQLDNLLKVIDGAFKSFDKASYQEREFTEEDVRAYLLEREAENNEVGA